MQYSYVSQDEQDDVIAQAIIQREKEHHNYEVNRLNYLNMLDQMSDLPDEWPDNLIQYRGLGGEQLAAALSGDDYTLASELQFRDRIRVLLTTTMAEQAKVEKVHAALCASLPEGERRDAAIQRVLAQQSGESS